jgi:anti-anti-sigma regulatory factor
LAAFSEAPILLLSKPVTAESLGLHRADVAQAVEAGAKCVIVDVDDVGVLDSQVIATLIIMLREARERGASVALRAGRKSILETLHTTALDRVFTIVTPGGVAPPPKTAPAKPRRRFVATLAAAFLAAAFAVPVGAASEKDQASAIVANIAARNPEMRTYEAQVHVDFQLRSFPYIAQHLEGTTYFKRPDNFEVVFKKIPSYAKGFDKLYADIDDPTSWTQRFTMSVVREQEVSGHKDVVLRLVQKVRGMIDHQDVAVNPAAWHIDWMEWHYYDGGTIAMSQEYQAVGGFEVLAKQHATIRIPFVHAAAEASYTDYRTNVAIEDAVFTKDKR